MEDERREKQDVKIDETVPLQTKDSVTIQRRKKEKKKNDKKTERKKKEKKPFVRGRRINKPDEPKIDFTKFKRVTQMTSHEKALSQKQIEQALKNGARIGTRNRIPESEQGRCVGLVQNALYNAWTEMPSYNDVGDRTVHLQIRLSRTGRIVSYRIVKSSGIASYDSSVLKAAAGCDLRATQKRTNAQKQLVKIDGLDHVIVDADAKAPLLGGKIVTRGHEKKGNIAVE